MSAKKERIILTTQAGTLGECRIAYAVVHWPEAACDEKAAEYLSITERPIDRENEASNELLQIWTFPPLGGFVFF